MSWFSFDDLKRGRNTDLSVFCNKNENSRMTVTRYENTLAVYKKIEQSSTDIQPCLQMSSNSSCHGLVLKIHSVVEIQI